MLRIQIPLKCLFNRYGVTVYILIHDILCGLHPDCEPDMTKTNNLSIHRCTDSHGKNDSCGDSLKGERIIVLGLRKLMCSQN